ncbi:hypothetical protein ADUPG1_007658 [Aduncisulcus paluster]|uniref:Uncharacterized protein n=1 Tax=Aduncisulcus paluster TaxID=2918883 RepID=A0ABQ5KP38_9EUKA|nr:hypothetical protein ADUPG1_007658 [Aduncisulcus paluster]
MSYSYGFTSDSIVAPRSTVSSSSSSSQRREKERRDKERRRREQAQREKERKEKERLEMKRIQMEKEEEEARRRTESTSEFDRKIEKTNNGTRSGKGSRRSTSRKKRRGDKHHSTTETSLPLRQQQSEQTNEDDSARSIRIITQPNSSTPSTSSDSLTGSVLTSSVFMHGDNPLDNSGSVPLSHSPSLSITTPLIIHRESVIERRTPPSVFKPHHTPLRPSSLSSSSTPFISKDDQVADLSGDGASGLSKGMLSALDHTVSSNEGTDILRITGEDDLLLPVEEDRIAGLSSLGHSGMGSSFVMIDNSMGMSGDIPATPTNQLLCAFADGMRKCGIEMPEESSHLLEDLFHIPGFAEEVIAQIRKGH